jgi:hypothetical protein
MSRLKNISEIKKLFEDRGCIVLSDEYAHSKQKIEYICQNGHNNSIRLDHFLNGVGCSFCNGKMTHDLIKVAMEKEGYVLLSYEYSSVFTMLKCECPCGHVFNTKWRYWKAGRRCPVCKNNTIKLLNFDKVKAEFDKCDYILLTTYLNNMHQSVNYVCPNGHLGSIRADHFMAGHRCNICAIEENADNKRHTIEFIRKRFEKEGYTLLSTDYKNSSSILKCICPNGHEYSTTYGRFGISGNRCKKCFNGGVSKQELDILNNIKLFANFEILNNDRNIIYPYELDIVIPSKKLAIEYCGLYWHSELAGKDKNYHLNKLNMCIEKGYRLITIFEDEWLNKQEIVESRLLNILNCSEKLKTIYARKCKIKEISATEARIFCEQNHLQGYTGSRIKLGAYYNDELVSVMTFAKPSISKGANPNELDTWELSRFCSKLNFRVVGIASKLLKHFERNYSWNKIFSYADRRWSTGNVYEKLGFKFIKKTQTNYWYVRRGERIHRFNLRKKSTEPKDVTEWTLRQEEGWNRIWDCGNLKYLKED